MLSVRPTPDDRSRPMLDAPRPDFDQLHLNLVKLPYLQYHAAVGAGAVIARTAAIIGRSECGAGLTLRDYATLRADGEHIRIGDNAYFGERATAHIADAKTGATIGDDVTVARFALVHACSLGDRVVVGEGVAVMDGAVIGDDAVIAADSIVSPGKKLAGGWLYRGVPAQPVREITPAEARAAAHSIRQGNPQPAVQSVVLPALSGADPEAGANGFERAVVRGSRSPTSYIAPTALLAGDVDLGDDAGIYFGCVVDAHDGRIVIGARTNVQDNAFLITSSARGALVLGIGATIGHNVQMGSGRFGDDALIGMMSRVEDDVVVEDGGCIAGGAWVERGTVVKAGWIWAGRPARPFRELRPAERTEFARGRDIYVEYGSVYR